MIYFEYDFCTDEAADFAIKRNRLLEHFTVEQVCELFCINVPPQPMLPAGWTRGQDIADAPGFPGEEIGRTGNLLPYAILHD